MITIRISLPKQSVFNDRSTIDGHHKLHQLYRLWSAIQCDQYRPTCFVRKIAILRFLFSCNIHSNGKYQTAIANFSKNSHAKHNFVTAYAKQNWLLTTHSMDVTSGRYIVVMLAIFRVNHSNEQRIPTTTTTFRQHNDNYTSYITYIMYSLCITLFILH